MGGRRERGGKRLGAGRPRRTGGRAAAGGAHGGQSAQAEHGCGRTAGLMSGHQVCASVRVARSREPVRKNRWSLQDRSCKPRHFMQLHHKKDEALHLWRSRCKKHGGLHAYFIQSAPFLAEASTFSQDSIAPALLESCKPRQFLQKKGLSCKPIDLLRSSRRKSWALHFPDLARTSRKPPHANPSFNCETNARSCVLCIFQPSHAVEQLTILTDRLVYCIVFAKKGGPCIWQPLSALPCRTKGPAGACRFEIIARDYNLWMGFSWGDPIFKDCRWKNPAISFL